MDKIMTKRVWLQHGLPTPGFVVLTSDADVHKAGSLGWPLMIKPPHEGSTLGITRVDASSELKDAYELAAGFDEDVLAEQFIKGREITVPILGKGAQAYALPIVEIIAPGGNYDYEHKYISNDSQYVVPAELDAEFTEQVQRIAEKAYRALGCEGWARADFMVSDDGKAWLLEMNTSPGMTSHSLVPMSARTAGMSYGELCVAILSSASCKVRGVSKN